MTSGGSPRPSIQAGRDPQQLGQRPHRPETVIWLIYRVACLVRWHNWWDAGEGELMYLDCGGAGVHQM
jgi:hypothetical protein